MFCETPFTEHALAGRPSYKAAPLPAPHVVKTAMLYSRRATYLDAAATGLDQRVIFAYPAFAMSFMRSLWRIGASCLPFGSGAAAAVIWFDCAGIASSWVSLLAMRGNSSGSTHC